jgi:hypothetical protein
VIKSPDGDPAQPHRGDHTPTSLLSPYMNFCPVYDRGRPRCRIAVTEAMQRSRPEKTNITVKIRDGDRSQSMIERDRESTPRPQIG